MGFTVYPHISLYLLRWRPILDSGAIFTPRSLRMYWWRKTGRIHKQEERIQNIGVLLYSKINERRFLEYCCSLSTGRPDNQFIWHWEMTWEEGRSTAHPSNAWQLPSELGNPSVASPNWAQHIKAPAFCCSFSVSVANNTSREGNFAQKYLMRSSLKSIRRAR